MITIHVAFRDAFQDVFRVEIIMLICMPRHRERLARKGSPGIDLGDAYVMANKKYKRWERLRMIMPWLKESE